MDNMSRNIKYLSETLNNIQYAYDDRQRQRFTMEPPTSSMNIQRRFSESLIDHLDTNCTWTDGQNVFVYDLSDEVLLSILKHLDSLSLLHFGDTCTRFHSLCRDPKLWISFDCLQRPMTGHQIAQCLRYALKKTHTFRVAGMRSLHADYRSQDITLTRNLLDELVFKCPRIREMNVTDATLDIDANPTTLFPGTLTSMTLRNCHSPSRSIFSGMGVHMHKLTELRIEKCDFFGDSDLISLSYLPQLHTLSLRGCRGYSLFQPYGIRETRYDFHKLHTLDIRDTNISHIGIHGFCTVKTLRTLMLESPRNITNEYETYINRTSVSLISDLAARSFGVAVKLENLLVGVTDDTLLYLAVATYLHQIDVSSTGVTAVGVAEFRLAKPTCVVLHDLRPTSNS